MSKITLASAISLLAGLSVNAPGSASADDALEPVDQFELNEMKSEQGDAVAFEHAFEAGDELSEFSFTAAQGVGANIGEGQLFTRFPRADLTGHGEWANHVPPREGGANATSCTACHNAPIANGAGDVAVNAIVDPAHTGDPSQYLVRNTLPVMALGVPQLLAEEMTTALHGQLDDVRQEACENGSASMTLIANGIGFGSLAATRRQASPCVVSIDTSGLEGIDDDLVVKPFGWKGNHSTIRAFTRGAAHNELGMQAVEIVGDIDGDFDGIVNELTVGDMTALAVYMAALERPVSTLELAELGLMEVDAQEQQAIIDGEGVFADVGCAACHTPTMLIEDTVFREPSSTPGFFDVAFPDGSDPAQHGLTGQASIAFDLTRDQPKNQIPTTDGEIHLLGALPQDAAGRGIARWFTDLKRHDMGQALADPSDPLDIGASMFLTRSLAGVGSTGPWLHDGRATTLHDAILAHGGEAEESRDGYVALDDEEVRKIIAFLESLVIYDNPIPFDED